MEGRLKDLLALSYVNRWAITPMFRSQTVADHSFRVAAIAIEIYDRCTFSEQNSGRQSALLYWSIVHDATESYTGDLPSPFKEKLGKHMLHGVEESLCPWWANEKHSVTPDIRAIVHIADTIEALSWVSEHGGKAKWKFGKDGDRPLAEVLHSRIISETNYYHFMNTVPGLRAAVKSILEELCLVPTLPIKIPIAHPTVSESAPDWEQVQPASPSSSPKSPSKEPSKSGIDLASESSSTD